MAFNMNPHQKMGGAMASKGAPKAAPKMDGGEGHEDGPHSQLHDHGDGTFHTLTHDGERTEHPHIGHALTHLGAHHAGGMHMHIHHDGASMTSHHAGEDGEVQGPHSHENIEALKDHLGKFFSEEESEGGGGGYGGHEGAGVTGLEE